MACGDATVLSQRGLKESGPVEQRVVSRQAIVEREPPFTHIVVREAIICAIF
jgi:hypothetical protein